MPKQKQVESEYVQPREAFSGDHDGVPFVLNPSEILHHDHELVRKFPDKFVPATRIRGIERMTAAPGEKRG